MFMHSIRDRIFSHLFFSNSLNDIQCLDSSILSLGPEDQGLVYKKGDLVPTVSCQTKGSVKIFIAK